MRITALDGQVTTLGDTVSSMALGGGMKYFHTQSTKADSTAGGTDAVAVGPAAQAAGARAVAAGNEAVASGNGSLALGSGATASASSSVALGEGASDGGRGAESYTGQYSNAANTSVGTVSVGNAATGQTRTLSNVADGRTGTDAVNVRQLDGAVAVSRQYTDQSVSNVTGAVGSVATALGNVDKRVSAVQDTVTAVQNGTDGMFQVQNTAAQAKPKAIGINAVAGGPGAVASGDNSVAVGTQAQASGPGAVAVGNGANASAPNSAALGAGSVADRPNSVSVGMAGSERQLINVAPATQGTDAVNFDQLSKSVADMTSNANAYTDQRYSELHHELQKQDDTLSAGIAGAMAMASLPQPYNAGASMTSVAAANYRGQSALSVGVSKISDNGRWVTKLQASTSTQGNAGVGVGVGYQW